MDFFNNMLEALRHGFARLAIDRPARWLGLDRLIERLEKSGQRLEKRISRLNGRAANQQVLAHIIGIERWGLRRIRVALGEPVVEEEYDAYRPTGQDWGELVSSLRATRQATVALSKTIRMAGVDTSTRVLHNQFGEISLLGWLLYLELHASVESLRLS